MVVVVVVEMQRGFPPPIALFGRLMGNGTTERADETQTTQKGHLLAPLPHPLPPLEYQTYTGRFDDVLLLVWSARTDDALCSAVAAVAIELHSQLDGQFSASEALLLV